MHGIVLPLLRGVPRINPLPRSHAASQRGGTRSCVAARSVCAAVLGCAAALPALSTSNATRAFAGLHLRSRVLHKCLLVSFL